MVILVAAALVENFKYKVQHLLIPIKIRVSLKKLSKDAIS
jgi:hypothetical protein